jgi:hypothetical protein
MQMVTGFVSGSIVFVQVLLATLNVLLPMAYFSTSKGSGVELSSYLKVLFCLVFKQFNFSI